ncbi:ABC transporter substrate-binding protein [Streptomyces sp. GC420]|nr:ABC transporter substrate-binding protein [Streptomyces sp. GC420]
MRILRRRGTPWPIGRPLAILLALTLLGGAAWWAVDRFTGPDSCGEKLVRMGPESECIGVTDGSDTFSDDLAEVSDRIAAENRQAQKRKPYATVAVMLPMTSPTSHGTASIRHMVQGAYLAQYRANRLSGKKAPAIRLVLANPGRGGIQWQHVAEQLRTMTDAPDNLRAVAGIGTSVRHTQAAVDWLTHEGIPVVGGSITADDIANKNGNQAFPGLARVAPTNEDEAAALASYAEKTEKADPADTLLVADRRTGDNYIDTLNRAFTSLLAGESRAPETFKSPDDVDSEGRTANDFAQMVPTICDAAPSTIYFAGRPVQLRQFINELGQRGCTEKKFTVLTGDAANDMIADPDLDWDALSGGITLRYAALAHPDAWVSPDAPKTGGSAADSRAFADLAQKARKAPVGPVGKVDLRDGDAMIAHDSVWTAVTAIRNTTSGEVEMPELADVSGNWPRLHSVKRVSGASGWICLDNDGNPYDKAVPVVTLDPRPKGPRFTALAWPEGKPPARTCTAPE